MKSWLTQTYISIFIINVDYLLKGTLYFYLFFTPSGTYCVFGVVLFWLRRLRMNIWFFPGGLDIDVFCNGLISEELARGCAGIGGAILNNTLGVSKIMASLIFNN